MAKHALKKANLRQETVNEPLGWWCAQGGDTMVALNLLDRSFDEHSRDMTAHMPPARDRFTSSEAHLNTPRPHFSARRSTEELTAPLRETRERRLKPPERREAERKVRMSGMHDWLLKHSQPAVPVVEISKTRKAALRARAHCTRWRVPCAPRAPERSRRPCEIAPALQAIVSTSSMPMAAARSTCRSSRWL